MENPVIFVLCSFAVITAQDVVELEEDVPFLSVPYLAKVDLKCCVITQIPVNHTWIRSFSIGNKVKGPELVKNVNTIIGKKENHVCNTLTLKSVDMNDTGLYQCKLNFSQLLTHGTYLQVYKPLQKTLNLSESTKNKILTAEGVLLLLCVLLPSVTLLFKSKRVNELEKKKVKKEEENIYQGLNLDDCCTTYDQIERSQANGPYQDVCNIIEEEEDMQLEKP